MGRGGGGVKTRADVEREEWQHVAVVGVSGKKATGRKRRHDAGRDGDDNRPNGLMMDGIDQPGAVGEQQCDETDQSRYA